MVLVYWWGSYDADNNPAAALLWLATTHLLIWGFPRLGVSNQEAYNFEGTMRNKWLFYLKWNTASATQCVAACFGVVVLVKLFKTKQSKNTPNNKTRLSISCGFLAINYVWESICILFRISHLLHVQQLICKWLLHSWTGSLWSLSQTLSEVIE